ncbi:hypothetical protein OUZ56_021143 [Daphnia magna]|uniref:Uncharacterized protein n=1 Tax=Daphnia magna TaxID=35525 RepID=A0ABQ9ZGJ4_9CRUS|nr:hypothetical protein OUZ56_021143 [Daphnia magna]
MTCRDCVSKEVHEADYGRGCIAILSPFFNNPRRGKQKHREGMHTATPIFTPTVIKIEKRKEINEKPPAAICYMAHIQR